ncbi:hypothetical protein BS78_07G061400 [Paspalum vaginatum]|nr:hypothetical protein BS78_07G061400 [Paspalum vaginatum]
MQPPTVKIIGESRVAAPATAALPPEPISLSALDAQWVTLPLIQRVLIFAFADAGGVAAPPFSPAVAALRASLADTLARFPTLGGRVVHLAATSDAAIDCAAGGGVRFVVAEAEDADAARLAGDEDHDAEAFQALVPGLDAGTLPAEAMAAQATRLNGGGIALGVAMHHAVVDGRSVWAFLQAWAAACRGDVWAGEPPTFDRAVIRLPGGDELARDVLRKYAPDLPVATVAGHLIRPNLSRRTFTITAQHMRRLKHRVAAAGLLSPAQGDGATTPSSFVAVAALAWVSFVRAKHAAGVVASAADEVYLFFFADCRARLDPAPGERYFGTCISGCMARAAAGDLLAEGGLGAAAAAVAAEVRRAAEDPLAGWDWMGTVEGVDMDRLVHLAGSTRFPAYEAADFGWGPPSRTELVTMNHDGQVVLVAGKGGDGGVQASVSLHPAHMDDYKSHFIGYIT